MPRYFFHTADHVRDRDVEGTMCSDLAEARRHAIRFAGAIVNDEPELLAEGRDFRVDVTDGEDRLLFSIIMLTVNTTAAEMPREQRRENG